MDNRYIEELEKELKNRLVNYVGYVESEHKNEVVKGAMIAFFILTHDMREKMKGAL